ncbi:cysK [Symbiodinium sp. CCMP2592]|nr:cysK [Symbiodinium sp. CCMP2592]
MAMETSADISHRARRVLIGAKMRQSKESWDELFHAADKDRSKTLDLKELTQVACLPDWRIGMTRFLVLLPLFCSAQFICRDPGWSDDFCSPQGTNVSGCSSEGYGVLPKSPDWMQIRQRLIREMFGQEMLPRKSRPDSVTTKAVRHLFPDCLYAAWGSGNRSDCEKTINVTEILWTMPARLRANYSMTLTSKVFLTLSTSGYAPNYDIWGAGQPADPELPRRGKTLVLFHNGHGMSKGCPTYGDTDGSADWLNQMGFDVATIMMPFKDCNSDPHDPHSLHAWFQPFEDEGKPWVKYFLEPVINTINFAIDSLAYERIIMMGLSGGGWTTTLAAAVDPRIVLSIPIAGSLPCDFRHTSWDFEQYCSDRWAQIGNYTALYVLAALEKGRASVQMLHESDPCCFHACGRHSRIQDYNRFVNSAARGVFQTVVTEGNLHQFNPREKVIAATLIGKVSRKEEIKACDVQSPFNVLREKLRIPDTTLPDHEIQVVFCEIDLDKTGAISGPEFSKFVSRGPLNPEEEAKLFAVRVKRVHRNLRLGFRNYKTDDAAVRRLFDRIDRGGDGRISMHELMGFVREDLKLTKWDVFESEMKAFYKSMDDNGDGLDANELVKFIRHTRAANGKQNQRSQTGPYRRIVTLVGGCRSRWPHGRRVPGASAALRAQACLEEAQRAEQRQEPLQAQRRFEEAAQLWSRIGGREALAAEAWAEAGRLRLELGASLDAVVACEHGLRLSARHWRLGFLSALALESIGLLSTAEERLQQAARLLTEVAAKDALSAVLEALRRVRARTAQLQAGEPQALMEEIQRMGSLLGDKEAGYWISSVGECSRSAEGQAELVQKGFLDSSQRDVKQPVAVARKASLVAMRRCLVSQLFPHGRGAARVEDGRTIYAKLEYFNPLSSVKDRTACAIVEDAEKRGLLKHGSTLIEATSGNTGIALAMLCAQRGYRCVIVLAESFSIERRKMMRFLGAKVVTTPKSAGGTGMVAKAKELAEKHGWFLCHQFENEANARFHYDTTGREILHDFQGVRLDYFVAGYGTGGTFGGVGKAIREQRPSVKLCLAEPMESPMLRSGMATERREDGSPVTSHPAFKMHPIQGWAPDFIPKIVEDAELSPGYDQVVPIPSSGSADMSRRLATTQGIFTGYSGGASVLAAVQVAQDAPEGSVVLTVIADTGERYLSTPLFSQVSADMNEVCDRKFFRDAVAAARAVASDEHLYRVNKKLQRFLSGAGLLLGVAEQCVLPKALRHPGASELLGSAAEVLKTRRLAVVDGAFPPEAIAQVQSELRMLRSEQVLQNDVNDVCNPLQEAKYLPYGADDAASAFRAKCPITMQVTRQLAGLAAVLEELLGLDLAVPQSVMAACYPPHASYKMHLDSYFLQGCPDDVPRKVTVLLYCNHGWSPQVGGELRAWGPFDQGQGPAQTIEPLPGRMVVFLSEEIWHEVLESHGERFALVDKFSFVEDTSTSSAQLRRRPTYRTQLLSDRMPKSQSAGELRSGGGSPTFVSTPSFVNLGRTRPPMVR